MTPIGSKREGGILQAAQIPNKLTILGTPQPGILLNSLFQLGVGDLTLCPSCCDSYRPWLRI